VKKTSERDPPPPLTWEQDTTITVLSMKLTTTFRHSVPAVKHKKCSNVCMEKLQIFFSDFQAENFNAKYEHICSTWVCYAPAHFCVFAFLMETSCSNGGHRPVSRLPSYFNTIQPDVASEWFTLLLRIREVPGSNIGPEADVFRGFSQSFDTNAGIVP
jgi:hypothetical protein